MTITIKKLSLVFTILTKNTPTIELNGNTIVKLHEFKEPYKKYPFHRCEHYYNRCMKIIRLIIAFALRTFSIINRLLQAMIRSVITSKMAKLYDRIAFHHLLLNQKSFKINNNLYINNTIKRLFE